MKSHTIVDVGVIAAGTYDEYAHHPDKRQSPQTTMDTQTAHSDNL